MSDPVPYKTGEGCYFIPWSDLRASGAWDVLNGSATSSATTDDAMRQIRQQAQQARAFLLGEPPPL